MTDQKKAPKTQPTKQKKYLSQKLVLIIPCLIVGIFLFWPVRIQPQNWNAPTDLGLTGEYSSNDKLSSVQRLELTSGYAPEDIAISKEGLIYAGLEDGTIVRVPKYGGVSSIITKLKARPLGMKFNDKNELIICATSLGLLKLDQYERIETLSESSLDVPIRFANHLDIASSGEIYFTDASHRFKFKNYRNDAFEHRGNGRLLKFNPATNETTTLISGLTFPNGVALSQNEDYLLLNETWNYRILKYWIAGPQSGKIEVFKKNLPGFLDGLSRSPSGNFWVTIAARRHPLLDQLSDQPFLRTLAYRFSKIISLDPPPIGFVFQLDESGEVTANFQDSKGENFAWISNVVEHNGTLFLGSLKESAVGWYAIPSALLSTHSTSPDGQNL